jgi:hypothetical protein
MKKPEGCPKCGCDTVIVEIHVFRDVSSLDVYQDNTASTKVDGWFCCEPLVRCGKCAHRFVLQGPWQAEEET